MRARLAILIPLATAVLVPTVGSLAAPPGSETTFTTYYGRGGSSISCAAGATCTADGTADGASGVATASASFARTVAAPGNESSFGYGSQKVTLKVPPRATKATVTFSWTVRSASADASSASGLQYSQAAITGWAPACREGSGCSYESQQVVLARAGSSDGVPYAASLGPVPATASVVVTITGNLPRNLIVDSYANAFALGNPSTYCVNGSCQTTSATHAGSAQASVEADLDKAEVVYE